MVEEPDKTRIFSASEVGNYVVCPEAWRLKYIVRSRFTQVDEQAEAFQLRQDWLQSADLSAQLKRYARIAFILLVILVFVVFLIDRSGWLRWRAKSSPAEQTQSSEPEGRTP